MLRTAIAIAAVIASTQIVRAADVNAGGALLMAQATDNATSADTGASSVVPIDSLPVLTPTYDINREFDGYYANVPGEP
jgi:hypothetical protein